jgi:two-component system, NarL family, nitrate/nitrite response regulator NarL
MRPTVRVVLADDHAPTRAGVRLALEQAEFDIVAEATTAPEAVRGALQHRPDVCLLDIYMPGGGIEAADEICQALPGTALVMLTASDSDDDLFAALRAGATGYLPKTTSADRLAQALRGVLAGEAALPRALTARLIEEYRQRPARGRSSRPGAAGAEYGIAFTDREREVVELMLRDLNTIEISQRLSISAVTVRRHISAVVRKAGVHSRRAAMDVLRRRAATVL